MGDHKHKPTEWARFQGDIGITHYTLPPAEGGIPVVGVAPHDCPDCSVKRVLIACIEPSGREVDIAVSFETAVLIANQIMAAALVIGAEGTA